MESDEDFFLPEQFWVNSENSTPTAVKTNIRTENTLLHSNSGNRQKSSHLNVIKWEMRARISNFPKDPAKSYADKIIKALNTFDPRQLFESLQAICSFDATFKQRLYSADIDSGLISMDFANLAAFCNYLRAWYIFVPDGVFRAFNHRIAVSSPPIFLFSSCLLFQGYHLVPEVDILRVPFHHYDPALHEQVAAVSCTFNPYFPKKSCSIEGSLILSVNLEGKVTGIELYLSHSLL